MWFTLIAKYWKVGLALLLALAAVGVVLHYRHVVAENARLEAANKQQAADLEASEKARIEIVKSGKKYENIRKEYREAPTGGCVGPAAGLALDGLRKRIR